MPVLEAIGRLARQSDAGRLSALLRRMAPTWLMQTPWLMTDDEVHALERSLQFVRPEGMPREFAVLMEELTDERALVLVLEDLHWSDPSTVDLLSILAERDEPARLLVIGTYRPAEAVVHEHPVHHVARTLQARRRCFELALSDLTVSEVQDYLRVRFPGNEFPSALAPRIHQDTDGNPLFVVGVVDSLLSRGHILETPPGWALPAPLEVIDLAVPDNVRLLIETQLDGLGPADRSLLQAASCAGEDFSSLVVAAALGQDVADTEVRCDALARARRFLRPAGQLQWLDHRVSPRYAFGHELYRPVVYAQITESQCMRLHQRIGKALEAAYGARRFEVAPRLAVHFERGRDDARAVEYLTGAAAGARRRFANREAIGYLEVALRLATAEDGTSAARRRELELRLALGAALSDIHGFASEEVLRNYARASELCARAGTSAQRLEILYTRWYVHALRAERKETVAVAAELSRLARRRGSAAGPMRAGTGARRVAADRGAPAAIAAAPRRAGVGRGAARASGAAPLPGARDPRASTARRAAAQRGLPGRARQQRTGTATPRRMPRAPGRRP
jgi:predicted ATPase